MVCKIHCTQKGIILINFSLEQSKITGFGNFGTTFKKSKFYQVSQIVYKVGLLKLWEALLLHKVVNFFFEISLLLTMQLRCIS